MSRVHKILALLSLSLNIYCEEIIPGLIGGEVGSFPAIQPYAATVSSLGAVTQLSSLPPTVGRIISVALNDSSVGLIGGLTGPNSDSAFYAAFITSNQVQPIPLPTFPAGFRAHIEDVAINQSNLGLIGGSFGTSFNLQFAYAAFASPTALTPFEIDLAISGTIAAVALNNSNIGLVGGVDGLPLTGTPYAAFVTPGSATPQPITLPGATGAIFSAALNDSGQGLLGGNQGAGVAFFVNTGSTTAFAVDLGPDVDFIDTVAINRSSVGLVGGGTVSFGAYAAFVFPNAATQIVPNLPPDALIESVAINNNGQGLIGGFNGSVAYAAFVNLGSDPIPINGLPSGTIQSVAINDFNQ